MCSLYDPGISAWTIPFPAVIHYISPGNRVPLFPKKSSWYIDPFCKYVMVSNPLWGWSGKPAGNLESKKSSIKNGSSLGTSIPPMILATSAPTPSDYSVGVNIF